MGYRIESAVSKINEAMNVIYNELTYEEDNEGLPVWFQKMFTDWHGCLDHLYMLYDGYISSGLMWKEDGPIFVEGKSLLEQSRVYKEGTD